MNKMILLLVFLVLIACLANWVTEYAIYASSMQTYGMAKFNIPLTVICTGVIIFFIEKNGIQTRKKIQDEFDELHERLSKEKSNGEKTDRDPFELVQQQEDADQ